MSKEIVALAFSDQHLGRRYAQVFDNVIVRMLQDRNPGLSRLYAKVLMPGEIVVGDEVKVVR